MSNGFRHNAAVIGSLLLFCSVGLGGWTQLNSGTTADLYSVHFPEGTQVGYAVGVDLDSLGGEVGLIIKTTDGGTTWVPQASGTTKALKSVYFKDNSNGFAVGLAGTAIRTTDGGVTWIPMTVPGSDELTRVQFPENGFVGYIGVHPQAGGGKIQKTTDGGGSWSSIRVGGTFVTSYSCGMATDSIGVVFGDSGFIVGNMDGPQDAQTNADLVAVAFSPDPTRAYLIGNDSIQGVIRYTDDGGATPWDSVRCYYPITAWYGVDMPTADVAYICGAGGRIDVSVSPTDFYRTITHVTADMHGVCFPHGADTGYVVGAGGTILRTYDGGIPWIPGVDEEKGPAIGWAGIRVVSNPSRHGVAFRSDADVDVVVFDAAGRVVARQAATKGLNFLPLSKAGVYFVHEGQAQAQAVRKVVVAR